MKKKLSVIICFLLMITAFTQVSCGSNNGETASDTLYTQSDSETESDTDGTTAETDTETSFAETSEQEETSAPEQTSHSHTYGADGKCTECEETAVFTEGLEYLQIEGKEEYALVGFGEVTDTEIYIPHTYEGKPVTEISGLAFSGCTAVKAVYIPSAVTVIKQGAFLQCTALEDVYIHEGVEKIEGGIFARCDSMKSINISPDNKNYHVSNNCLVETETKRIITSVGGFNFPTDGSAEIIGSQAYCTAVEGTAEIPEGITTLEEYAFVSCDGLTGIKIPSTVTEMSTGILYCFGIESVEISSDNEVYHSIGGCVIATESKKLVAAFQNAQLPEDGSITVIGKEAFLRSNIEKIKVPESVTVIEDFAFENCSDLNEVTLPASLSKIGDKAFYKCEALKNIYFSGTKEEWDSVEKGEYWDAKTESDSYTVHCSDGDLNLSPAKETVTD